MDMLYLLDDFMPFVRIRMNFRPEKNTILKTLFLRKPGANFIQILIGKLEGTTEEQKLILEGTDDPNGQSVYKSVIKFDERLLASF